MSFYAICFSPSGTTRRSIENVLAGMNATDVRWIDMTDPRNRSERHTFAPDDVVVYGTITAALLFSPNKQIFDSLEGNGAAFVGIAQYGNGYYGVTLRQLERRAAERGFNVAGVAAFVGQHSENAAVATGRPDAEDAKVQAAFGRDVLMKIAAGGKGLANRPPIGWSSSPRYNTVVLARLFMQGSDYVLPSFMKTKAFTDRCVQCGICERQCPMGAINLVSKSFDLKKCIACYRCVNRCPRKAIEVTSTAMNAIARDFGSSVGTKERLEAVTVL